MPRLTNNPGRGGGWMWDQFKTRPTCQHSFLLFTSLQPLQQVTFHYKSGPHDAVCLKTIPVLQNLWWGVCTLTRIHTHTHTHPDHAQTRTKTKTYNHNQMLTHTHKHTQLLITVLWNETIAAIAFHNLHSNQPNINHFDLMLLFKCSCWISTLEIRASLSFVNAYHSFIITIIKTDMAWRFFLENADANYVWIKIVLAFYQQMEFKIRYKGGKSKTTEMSSLLHCLAARQLPEGPTAVISDRNY